MISPHLPLLFGILGNIVSFLVFLSPVPTFYRIFKKKSTQGFESLPYTVSLFSAMLLLYYGILKKENGFMIITINFIGCTIEGVYIIMYLVYAPKKIRIYVVKLVAVFNFGAFFLIVGSTLLFVPLSQRTTVVGYLTAIVCICVFVAPLSVMRQVIKTKSVEFMPFPLSFFLTLCASLWFCYGMLIHDLFIAMPNIVGFTLGLAQMLLYLIYKCSYRSKDRILPGPTQIQVEMPAAVGRKTDDPEAPRSAEPKAELVGNAAAIDRVDGDCIV